MKVKLVKKPAAQSQKGRAVPITGEYIKLEALLKFAGIIPTGGEAKTEIQAGKVLVNGEVCLMRGKKLRPGDTAEYQGEKLLVEDGNAG